MFSFKKEERLCYKPSISLLFAKGKRMFQFPFQTLLLYGDYDFAFPAQVLIIVPKKKIKKSVDRNLIKRRMREAYRLHKNKLYTYLENNDRKIILAIVYQHNAILDFHTIEKSIIAIFEKIENNR